MSDLRTGTPAKIRKTVLMVLLIAIASVLLIVLFTNDSPINTFAALFRGAFVGKRNFGTTLATMTTLLMNAIAFSVANRAGFFNTGIDGDMYVGAMAATIVGIYGEGIPAPLLAVLCSAAAIVAGMLWALIPALLNVHLNVNVICVCIMMNSVAKYICQFFVVGPLSAKGPLPQTKPVATSFLRLLPPTRLNIGIFFAFAILAYIIWMSNKTTFGYELKTVGENRMHAEFAGINPKKVGIKAMMLSGAIAGFSGCTEILGNYGYFLNEFAEGIGSRGLLIALLVRCNYWLLPLSAFFISALATGSLTLQASTTVPKSLADTLTAMIILLVTMETLFLHKRRKNPTAAQKLQDKQEAAVEKEQMEIRGTPPDETGQRTEALAEQIVKADERTTNDETDGKGEN